MDNFRIMKQKLQQNENEYRKSFENMYNRKIIILGILCLTSLMLQFQSDIFMTNKILSRSETKLNLQLPTSDSSMVQKQVINLSEKPSKLVTTTKTTSIRVNNSKKQAKQVWNKLTTEWKFKREKQKIYQERRDLVHKKCQKLSFLQSDSWKDTLKNLIYLKQKQMVYCAIPKVASTFWTRSYMIIGGSTGYKKSHAMARKAFPLTMADLENSNLSAFTSNVSSMVIVRHPLSRLVSAYFSKIVNHERWSGFRKFILRMSKIRRGREQWQNNGTFDRPIWQRNITIPSPHQFVALVVDNHFKGRLNDPHWIPQYQICPFCQMNFTIFGKLEEMSSDIRYFQLLHHLSDQATVIKEDKMGLRKNPSQNQDFYETKSFWENLPRILRKRVVLMYSVDLIMFNYSASAYFKQYDVPLYSICCSRMDHINSIKVTHQSSFLADLF